MTRFLLLLFILCCAGCDEGAVVFAPTPLPPDTSPLRYQHPSGAFSIELPREWSVYAQNTATLATAFFTPPGMESPFLSVAVVNLESVPALVDILNAYQAEIRPDAGRYTEIERQPMGDGSWRFTGLRVTEGKQTQQVNTFIELSGSFLGVTEIVLPESIQTMRQLETSVNTLQINTAASLQPAPLVTLASAAHTDLEIINVSTWSTPQGVYFVTGEVVNHGSVAVERIPVRVELQTADNAGVAEALDTVMGYGIPPGGFAPFSLRFGQGQPLGTTQYVLTLGGPDWLPHTVSTIYGDDVMTWVYDSSFTPERHLLISGRLTNTSTLTLRDPLASVTVFDSGQNVIAAGFVPVVEGKFEPEAAVDFHIRVPEIGGEPMDYVVSVQALADE